MGLSESDEVIGPMTTEQNLTSLSTWSWMGHQGADLILLATRSNIRQGSAKGPFQVRNLNTALLPFGNNLENLIANLVPWSISAIKASSGAKQ